MSEFFARPWLLLAIPVIFWVLRALLQSPVQNSWADFLPAELAERLLTKNTPETSQTLAVKPSWVIGLLTLLFALSLAGLGYQLKADQLPSAQQELVIIQHLSPPIRGNAKPQNLLETSQRALIPLLNTRQEGKTALIYYAGSAHLVSPMTDDSATLRQLFSLTHTSVMPLGGNKPEVAFRLAASLGKLASSDKQGRLAWLWLTHELPGSLALQELIKLKPLRAKLYLVWLDASLTAVNKEQAAFADLGIVLLHPEQLADYQQELNPAMGGSSAENPHALHLFQELSHWPLLVALVLLLWHYLNQPRIKFPFKLSFKLRFWLLVLAVGLVNQPSAQAVGWQNTDYQARQAILAAKGDEALSVDKKLLGNKALKLAKRTDLKAHAEFLLGNYTKAAELFTEWQIESTLEYKLIDEKAQAEIFFNTGTAWLLAKQPSKALEAFKQAKALQPEEVRPKWPELCINQKLAEMLLTNQAAPTEQKLLALCGASQAKSYASNQEETEEESEPEEQDWQPQETSSCLNCEQLDSTQEKQLQQLQEDPWRLLKHRFKSELREQQP